MKETEEMPLAFKKRDSRSDSKIENKIRKKRCYGGSRTRNISPSVSRRTARYRVATINNNGKRRMP